MNLYIMFCSDISLYSDISSSQVASLASFYATPYPIQTGSTAYMMSLDSLHSWDLYALAHTVPSSPEGP